MSQKTLSNGPKAFTASLKLIATSYAVRCDAKYADHAMLKVLEKIRLAGSFQLGEYLPLPFVKGSQPEYLDQATEDSVPIISTLAIQNLAINERDCRHISREDFDSLNTERKLNEGDVLLTVDGGVSIGKPCLFSSQDEYSVDSHVVVLRPQGLGALALVYLLASPLGQMQFRRAESGASGQTTVTEDDIRRFIFPSAILKTIGATAAHIEKQRRLIAEKRAKLLEDEQALWQGLELFTK